MAATHSRGLFFQALFGSVAVDLVREASSPILLVPSRDQPPNPRVTPLQGPVHSVAAALDPSGDSDEVVLGHALRLARAWMAELHVLQVLVPSPAVAGATPGTVTMAPAPPAAGLSRDPVEHRLAEVVTDLRRRGVDARAHALEGADPADAVAEFAESGQADLLVVGHHDKTLLRRLLVGSASARIVRKVTGVGVMVCPLVDPTSA